MKPQQIKIKASVGRSAVIITENNDGRAGPKQRVEDAKKLCAFLLGVIPSGTFDEAVGFLKKFEKTTYPVSFSPAFEEYFKNRIKALGLDSDDEDA